MVRRTLLAFHRASNVPLLLGFSATASRRQAVKAVRHAALSSGLADEQQRFRDFEVTRLNLDESAVRQAGSITRQAAMQEVQE
jgi:hypothetical protein